MSTSVPDASEPTIDGKGDVALRGNWAVLGKSPASPTSFHCAGRAAAVANMTAAEMSFPRFSNVPAASRTGSDREVMGDPGWERLHPHRTARAGPMAIGAFLAGPGVSRLPWRPPSLLPLRPQLRRAFAA